MVVAFTEQEINWALDVREACEDIGSRYRGKGWPAKYDLGVFNVRRAAVHDHTVAGLLRCAIKSNRLKCHLNTVAQAFRCFSAQTWEVIRNLDDYLFFISF